jgi:hypothetical protein
MKKIIIFLYIFSANQVVAFDYKCVPARSPSDCSKKHDNPFINLMCEEYKQTSGPQYLNGKVCSGDRMCADVEAMFDNCLLDKMKGRQKYERFTVRNVCERIACHPTLIQKFKYR